MQKKNSVLPLFVVFFIIASILFFLSQKNITLGLGFLDNLVFPLQNFVFKASSFPQHIQDKQSIQKQEVLLVKQEQIADYNKLKQDNTALRDQFVTSQTQSYKLLPAEIIGAPAFVPGASKPENIIIGQGSKNGVVAGQAVVYKDNLVGEVKKVTSNAALVQ